ncbi:MAG TPA: hypothetical protein VFG46_09110 [Chryseolinea sp.]|nr:hypothetical protein [Chryseolinea sp.]
MDGLGVIIILILAVMFGPPLVFFIIGLNKRNTNKESAKVFYILAVVYLVIGGGICASMLLRA